MLLAFCFLLYGEVETLWSSLSDELTFLRLATRQMNALVISAGSNMTRAVSVPGGHLLDFWNCNSRHKGLSSAISLLLQLSFGLSGNAALGHAFCPPASRA